MHVAALQMRSTTDPAVNVETFETLVRDAASSGATYVQSPEMTGVVQRSPKKLHEVVQPQGLDPLFKCASKLAGELGIWVHVGSTPIKIDDDKIANRAGIFAPDGTLATTYDKIHMFDVDLENGESWRESAIYTPGEELGFTQVNDENFGISICYDLRFGHLYRDQALTGASILTVPAAFTKQTGERHWHVLLRARAIENGAFVIAAAQGGTHEDGRETYGHSLIIAPTGEILAEKNDDEPGVIDAVLDLDAVKTARERIPNLKNARTYVGAPV
ncbi:MAG: carbon-nitrogen hydrolase family protein [Pseudomonadota bacterium]